MNRKIVLKTTGEEVTFIKTASDTNGEFLEVLVTLPANGEGPPPHRHVLQTEQFEVLEGYVAVKCNEEKVILKPGQKYTVPANALHTFSPANGTDLKFRATLKPALHFQYILTEVFNAINNNKKGRLSIFNGSYILNQAKGEYILGGVPVFIQKNIFPVIATVGKVLGLVTASANHAQHN